MANGKSSMGAHVAPPSVLFQSGRAPVEVCSGFTSGKSAEVVVPATNTSPAAFTATPDADEFALPPSPVSKIFRDPSAESLNTRAYPLPVAPNIFVGAGAFKVDAEPDI